MKIKYTDANRALLDTELSHEEIIRESQRRSFFAVELTVERAERFRSLGFVVLADDQQTDDQRFTGAESQR